MKKQVKKAVHKVNGMFARKPASRPYRKPPGQAPGTVIYTGQKKLDQINITVHDFDLENYQKISLNNIEKSEPFLESESKTWIQVQGLHDIEKLQTIWAYFGLHPLIQEDIVNTSQRPKVEMYDDHVFIVLRMIISPQHSANPERFQTEQISIVLGKNYVLSFQESDSPIFDPVIKRLEIPSTRLRRYGPDYLAYALVDNVVDHYFHVLDFLGETIENTEDEILNNPEEILLQQIHSLRRDLIFFRKSVWPLRDNINLLIRDETPLIHKKTKIYIRDVYDHIVQVIDSLENNREMIYGLYDMYMSGLSNRMNEVMKVLTIIATIFIPLTFIAGIYGMNFNPETSPYNLPELNWYYGYPLSILAMLIITAGMIFYFRRKKWL